MFYLSGVGLALFLNLLLLGKRNKTTADLILGFWLFIIALHLLLFTFSRENLYPVLLGIDLPLPLLHGPLLYLYTRALTGKSIGWKQTLIHLALPLACYVYLIPFIMSPVKEKTFVYANQGVGYETFMAIRAVSIPLSGILYVALSLIRLQIHRRTILQQFSSIEKVNLIWLQYLIFWLGGIWFLVIFGNDYLVFSASVIFVFFIGYFGIRQGVIHHIEPISPEPVTTHQTQPHQETSDQIDDTHREVGNLEITSSKAKYLKSGLTADTSQSLHQNLTDLMDRERLFRNSELTLVELAERLSVSPNHLSQVINEHEGKNFYEYVNSLRVSEFVKVAATPESRRLTLFALAQECGFNSKSSFNRHFKKITGKSPSEFVSENQ
jgi:AraC-like DNA-binding protein